MYGVRNTSGDRARLDGKIMSAVWWRSEYRKVADEVEEKDSGYGVSA